MINDLQKQQNDYLMPNREEEVAYSEKPGYDRDQLIVNQFT